MSKIINDDAEVTGASVNKNEVIWFDKSGKKKKQEMSGKEKSINLGSDYEKRKAAVNREANSKTMQPISHEIFKKSKDEKEQLKAMKAIHKSLLKQHGLDPKKVMNPSKN